MEKKFSLRETMIAIFAIIKKWNQSIGVWCRDKVSRFPSIKIPWKGLFNSVVQLGTIVATVVAIYALRETRLQRESTYKPVVFIESSRFFAERGEMNKYQYYVEQDDSLVRINREPYFSIVNVGMGCAFNVVTDMQLNSEMIVSFLKEEGLTDVQTIQKDFIKEIVVDKQDTIRFFSADYLINDMVSYVLPVNQSTENYVQRFIPEVNEMILDVVRLVERKKGEGAYSLSFPIDVNYKDLNGKLYSSTCIMEMRYVLAKEDGLIMCTVSSRLTREDYIRNSFNPGRKEYKEIELPASF